MDLQYFFEENPRVALAFSGGVDSAYLLYSGIVSGADIRAYYVHTAFQPQFELRDAKRLAADLDADFCFIEADIMNESSITSNLKDRCYYCKYKILSNILEAAARDGYHVVIDGTNASDSISDRPGTLALSELKVRSPLKECGLTKEKIREMSRAAGLFTWNKPSYSCLATRIPQGREITAELLNKVEHAEDYMMSLKYRNFRVRLLGSSAKIELQENQIGQFFEQREMIRTELLQYFDRILLDTEVRDEE